MRNLPFLMPVLLLMTFSSCNSGNNPENIGTEAPEAIRTRDDNTEVDQPMDTSLIDTTNTTLSLESVKFIMDAASNTRLAIDLGKLAQEKSTDPQIIAFGKNQVQAYTITMRHIKDMAAERNISIPVSMLRYHIDTKMDLLTLEKNKFDKTYMKWIIEDLRESIKQYENITRLSPDPIVTTFANQTLPVLRARLDTATALYHNQ